MSPPPLLSSPATTRIALGDQFDALDQAAELVAGRDAEHPDAIILGSDDGDARNLVNAQIVRQRLVLFEVVDLYRDLVGKGRDLLHQFPLLPAVLAFERLGEHLERHRIAMSANAARTSLRIKSFKSAINGSPPLQKR